MALRRIFGLQITVSVITITQTADIGAGLPIMILLAVVMFALEILWNIQQPVKQTL